MRPGRILFALAVLLAAAGCLGATNPSKPARSLPTEPVQVPADALVIENGRVITGTGAAPIPDGVVVVLDQQVIAVGRAADFAIPPSAQRVDARGGTILPGIFNAHVHTTSSPAARRVYFLLKGVTSVCDMGSQLKEMAKFAEDHRLGPASRGFRSGPIVTVPGGYPDNAWAGSLNYEIETPGEARAGVADLIERGADVIKIALEPGSVEDPWPMLNLEQVQAIVEEAHARGRLVRAHVGRSKGSDVLDIVLNGGVDIIDHVPIPVFSAREEYDIIMKSGSFEMTPADRDEMAQLAAHHVMMVPTLTAHTLWCRSAGLTQAQQEACYAFYEERVRTFHESGGIVALANDYGADGALERGIPLLEMKLLLASGLTPMEVIEASTRNAARVCGHGDELGTLEPGKLADVIIVDGNPLEDIEAMSRVLVVIKGGEVVVPAGLSQ